MNIRRLIPGAAAGIIAAALSAASLALGTVPASAAATVTASTSVSAHPDTTSASGPACTSSAGGPVWADDTYASKFTATQTAADKWQVVISDSGTFTGFADPVTCDALGSFGDLSGQISYTVTSSHTPSQATLKSSYSGAVSGTQMVQDFFGDPDATLTDGTYLFSYQGGNYVQDTTGSFGDVVASSPPVVPTPSGLHQTVSAGSAALAWGDTVSAPATSHVTFWLRSSGQVIAADSGTSANGHWLANWLHANTAYCWTVYITKDGYTQSAVSAAVCFTTPR